MILPFLQWWLASRASGYRSSGSTGSAQDPFIMASDRRDGGNAILLPGAHGKGRQRTSPGAYPTFPGLSVGISTPFSLDDLTSRCWAHREKDQCDETSSHEKAAGQVKHKNNT